MAFTNLEIVKKHLIQERIGSSKVENFLLQLTGNSFLKLPDSNILLSSEKVKGKEIISPVLENISFASGDTVTLLHSELILDTVVVAKDSSLGQLFVENVDYSIDYDSGKISRIAGGAIASGSGVALWYLYFRVYQNGSDYQIDYSNGKIARKTNGSIEDGQWVWMDYTLQSGFLEDDLISNAILEADAKILDLIDSQFYNCTDQNLVSVETYWTVSILCNIKSLEVMNQALSGVQAKALSHSWAIMSNVYRKKATELLAKFAKSPGALTSARGVKSTK